MNSRDEKKWKPFNAVVPARVLLEKDTREQIPTLSKDMVMEFEERLKESMYLKSLLKIYYIENGKRCSINDYVVGLDPLKKNVFLKTKTINFRQIYDIR